MRPLATLIAAPALLRSSGGSLPRPFSSSVSEPFLAEIARLGVLESGGFSRRRKLGLLQS